MFFVFFDQILTIFKYAKHVQNVENLDFLEIEFIHVFKPKFDEESDAQLKKMVGTREKGVSSTF